MPDTWPPDWREARAAAGEAEVVRLGEFLVFVDEVEQLVGDDEALCRDLRTVAGRLRARTSQRRDEAHALRSYGLDEEVAR